MLKKIIIDCKNNKENLKNFISDFERDWNKKSFKANFWIFDNKEFNTIVEFKKYLKKIKKINNKLEVIKENKIVIEKNKNVVIRDDKNRFLLFENRKLSYVYKNRFEFQKFINSNWDTEIGYIEQNYFEYIF